MFCPSYQPPHILFNITIGPLRGRTVVSMHHPEFTVTFGVFEALLFSPWLGELKHELISQQHQADGYRELEAYIHT